MDSNNTSNTNNSGKENDYIVRNVYRSFLIVCTLAMVSSTVGALVDNIIVGRFMGTEALGAMGIVMPVNFLFMALGTLCASGGAIMLSQAIGQGDMARVRSIFSAALIFDVASGVLICVAGQIFIDPVASILGASGELHILTVQYLRGFFFSAPAIIAMGMLMQFIQIDGSARLSLLATITLTVSDIIFDFIVVAVKGGMFGMAMATTLSFYMAIGVIGVHFTRKHCTLKFVIPKNPLKLLAGMFRTSLPAVSIMIGELVRTAIFNNWLVIISVTAVAALNVRGQAQNLVGALALGGAQAIAAMTAMFYGEEDRDALKGSLKSALQQGFAVNAAAGVIFAIVPFVFPVMMGMTGADEMSMASMAVRCLAIALPLRFVNLLLSQYYQSIGRTVLASSISIMEVLAAPVFFAALLRGKLGADGIWIAFPLGDALTLIATLAAVMILSHAGSTSGYAASTSGHAGSQADRSTSGQAGSQADRSTSGQAGSQADRSTSGQATGSIDNADGQADRSTSGQATGSIDNAGGQADCSTSGQADRAGFLDWLLLLPDDFGSSDEDRLSVSIGNSMDEVMATITKAYTFGEQHGIGRSTLDKVSLCIEELAGNIVQHAFRPGEKRWFDILIYIKEDQIFIRMRDNGRQFDPLAYLRELAQGDPEAGLGLKIINGITENFEYHSGIGLNISVMTLRIK